VPTGPSSVRPREGHGEEGEGEGEGAGEGGEGGMGGGGGWAGERVLMQRGEGPSSSEYASMGTTQVLSLQQRRALAAASAGEGHGGMGEGGLSDSGGRRSGLGQVGSLHLQIGDARERDRDRDRDRERDRGPRGRGGGPGPLRSSRGVHQGRETGGRGQGDGSQRPGRAQALAPRVRRGRTQRRPA